MRKCVVIPAYNAAKTLPELIERLAKSFAFEDIIVVDDGSVDETAEVLKRYDIKSISLGKNFGKGYALQKAFSIALAEKYDVIITIDADLQHPPELIDGMMESIAQGADMAIGNRMNDSRSMPLQRRLSNSLSTIFTSILAGRRLKDSQCGFRAIRRWVLEKIDIRTERYQVESEMLIEAARCGAKIDFIDMPTIYNGNGSHFRPIIDTARFVLFLFLYYPVIWFSAKRDLRKGMLSDRPKNY